MFARKTVEEGSQRRCAELFVALSSSHRREVMAQLCFDRIGDKQEYIVDRFHDTDDWNETAYYMLMRSLDIGPNRGAYETLARILPYKMFDRVAHERQSVMAMLLGSAGLLDRLAAVCSGEAEVVRMKEIFDYDAHKYGLVPMNFTEWQLAGLRGDNHPIVRLLQAANVIARNGHLLDAMLQCRTVKDVERLFCTDDIPRWAYRFLSSESDRGGNITRTKAQMLGINVVAQMQIVYSEFTMRDDLDSSGIDLLEQLPAENNMFVRRWAKLGVTAESALDSQALLQLSKAYCASSRCEKCPFKRFVEAK